MKESGLCFVLSVCVCVCVCVCVYVAFSHITTVAACCMRRHLQRSGFKCYQTLMYRVADTIHDYTIQSHHPDTGPTSPGVILLM